MQLGIYYDLSYHLFANHLIHNSKHKILRLFYVVIQIFIELLFLVLLFQLLNNKMIIFISCREEGEKAMLGSNLQAIFSMDTLQRKKVSAFFFSSIADFLYG